MANGVGFGKNRKSYKCNLTENCVADAVSHRINTEDMKSSANV